MERGADDLFSLAEAPFGEPAPLHPGTSKERRTPHRARRSASLGLVSRRTAPEMVAGLGI